MKSSEDADVIVLGAGMGGLCAAAYLVAAAMAADLVWLARAAVQSFQTQSNGNQL